VRADLLENQLPAKFSMVEKKKQILGKKKASGKQNNEQYPACTAPRASDLTWQCWKDE